MLWYQLCVLYTLLQLASLSIYVLSTVSMLIYVALAYGFVQTRSIPLYEYTAMYLSVLFHSRMHKIFTREWAR